MKRCYKIFMCFGLLMMVPEWIRMNNAMTPRPMDWTFWAGAAVAILSFIALRLKEIEEGDAA